MILGVRLVTLLAVSFVVCRAYLLGLASFHGVTNNKFMNGRNIHTRLYAHHVNKKITKRMMDRRPKKHRPSDITRNNVNQDKCITKIEDAPDDFTLMSAEEFLVHKDKAQQFWEHGDSEVPWHFIMPEDEVTTLRNNREPPPPGTRKRGPPLARSGTGG